jgi:hypothetical protein
VLTPVEDVGPKIENVVSVHLTADGDHGKMQVTWTCRSCYDWTNFDGDAGFFDRQQDLHPLWLVTKDPATTTVLPGQPLDDMTNPQTNLSFKLNDPFAFAGSQITNYLTISIAKLHSTAGKPGPCG